MLVTLQTRLRDASRRQESDERGATLVVVMIVMMVLMVGAVVIAAMVTNTASSLVSSRSTVQSRAAADAGLAAAVAAVGGGVDPCALSESSTTEPKYSVKGDCDISANKVTFTSIGNGAGGHKTTVQAVYVYDVTPAAGAGAEMVSFSTTDFQLTNRATFVTGAQGATFLFPGGGDVTSCQTVIPATVLTKGSFVMDGNCEVQGDVHTGGDFTMRKGAEVRATATAPGNVEVAGNSSVSIDSAIGGIDGQLKLDPSASLNLGNVTQSPRIYGGKANGIVHTSVEPPSFDTWFDYRYKASDWPGYAPMVITPTSSPYSCSSITASNTDFWTTYLTSKSAESDLVLDLRACGTVSLDSVAHKTSAQRVATLANNVVILTEGFRPSNREFNPVDPANSPSVWIVVEDKLADGNPTCNRTAPAGVIDTGAQGTQFNVRTMAYTPCNVIFANGANAKWTGSVYAGQLQIMGSIEVKLQPLALPGQWVASGGGPSVPGSKKLGALVSQRDIP